MTTLHRSTPKARKEHRCNFCNGNINKGEVYDYSTHVFDGDLYDWKSHLRCTEVAAELNMFEDCPDGVTEDDFTEFINNHFFDFIATDDQTYKNTNFPQRLFAVQDKVLTNKQ